MRFKKCNIILVTLLISVTKTIIIMVVLLFLCMKWIILVLPKKAM